MAKTKALEGMGLATPRQLKVVRQAKRAGFTEEEIRTKVRGNVDVAAKEQGWRTSEHAMAMASWESAIRRVYRTKTGGAR